MHHEVLQGSQQFSCACGALDVIVIKATRAVSQASVGHVSNGVRVIRIPQRHVRSCENHRPLVFELFREIMEVAQLNVFMDAVQPTSGDKIIPSLLGGEDFV